MLSCFDIVLLYCTLLQPDLASEEIDHLLKRGAYDVFREDDEEGKDFVEANIDDIMKRAATKVLI